jgi:hypothetical protein
VAALLAGSCGEDEEAGEPPPTSERRAEAPNEPRDQANRGGGQYGGSGHRRGGGQGEDRRSRLEEAIESGGRAEPEDTAEREAIATARAYVRALDAGDGRLVCNLLVAGALDGFELPRERRGCPSSLDASIGYRDPRGLPVWEGAEVGSVPGVEVQGTSASVTLTVITEFADRKQVSVEDDIIYLERHGGGWKVAKPSPTLYRAIGSEPPPQAIAAP